MIMKRGEMGSSLPSPVHIIYINILKDPHCMVANMWKLIPIHQKTTEILRKSMP